MNALRLAGVLLAIALLAACNSANVVSEGDDSSLMLKGHDPVAYFTAGRPVRGNPAIKAEHRGLTYRFASEDSRRTFLTSPDRFVPQYGGFCANGLVYAIPLGGEAENFKIIGGKLYMFGGTRSKLYFEMDQERNLRLADQYWESEVKDASWRLQSWKRLVLKVPHYKTNAELAEEYEKRFGKKPG
jgi:YHS domain-containing protein